MRNEGLLDSSQHDEVAYTMIERAPTIFYLCIIVPCFVAIKVANRRNEQRNSDNPQTAMGR